MKYLLCLVVLLNLSACTPKSHTDKSMCKVKEKELSIDDLASGKSVFDGYSSKNNYCSASFCNVYSVNMCMKNIKNNWR